MLKRVSFEKDIRNLYKSDVKTINIYNMSLSDVDFTDFTIFGMYKDRILKDAYLLEFDDQTKIEYNKNPRRLAKEIYGTTDYYFIILQSNDFRCETEMDLFQNPEIILPSEEGLRFFERIYTVLMQKRKTLEIDK